MRRRFALSDSAAKLLISEVHKRACLWDADDDQYNDRYLMARAWSEIAEIIKMPEDHLRVKWKNMRDLFKKEAKRFGVDDYAGKWRHFAAMSFLNKNNVASNTSENNEDSSEPQCVVTKQEYIELDEGHSAEVEPYYEESYEDPLPEKRVKVNLDEDYDIMFLKSLAPYFKQLDPIRKLVVRSKMQDMLLNEIAAQTAATQFKKS